MSPCTDPWGCKCTADCKQDCSRDSTSEEVARLKKGIPATLVEVSLELDLFTRRLKLSEECRENLFAALTEKNQQLLKLSEAVRQLAADWKRAAEDMRLNRGQRTREKAGHEVLANCAYALEDVQRLIREAVSSSPRTPEQVPSGDAGDNPATATNSSRLSEAVRQLPRWSVFESSVRGPIQHEAVKLDDVLTLLKGQS